MRMVSLPVGVMHDCSSCIGRHSRFSARRKIGNLRFSQMVIVVSSSRVGKFLFDCSGLFNIGSLSGMSLGGGRGNGRASVRQARELFCIAYAETGGSLTIIVCAGGPREMGARAVEGN